MPGSQRCGFLELPPELRLQIYQELLIPGPHKPLYQPLYFRDHRSVFRKSQDLQASPVTCSVSMYPAIFTVNHQLKSEAQSVLDECNVWEIRTADLLEDVGRDTYGEVVSKLCSVTMDVLEQHLQRSHIQRWYLVIDTTFYGYDEQDGYETLLGSELRILSVVLQRFGKLLAVTSGSPEVTLSWRDDGFLDREDRRRLLFGRLLTGLPASPSYKVGSVPNNDSSASSRGDAARSLVSREVFAQSMTEDLGIVVR
ncbi:MAG: hypothetical protein L6R38_000376 [Xanthoria sp. 2 TBL-2021]|nr:MAG: hypothetical protein L6R38_000376 [Xanthoria sp. 2 TBL-2021]